MRQRTSASFGASAATCSVGGHGARGVAELLPDLALAVEERRLVRGVLLPALQRVERAAPVPAGEPRRRRGRRAPA